MAWKKQNMSNSSNDKRKKKSNPTYKKENGKGFSEKWEWGLCWVKECMLTGWDWQARDIEDRFRLCLFYNILKSEK